MPLHIGPEISIAGIIRNGHLQVEYGVSDDLWGVGPKEGFANPVAPDLWQRIDSTCAACPLFVVRAFVVCVGVEGRAIRPPPPPPLCRPKFQPPQSEGAGRGLVPRGDQETGEQTFCCPHPPQQKWGRTESRPSTPPPPRMPSHPHCRPSHGDPGPSGSGRRATSMLGSGTRMVTQQVVLLSHASEQVDPSTTLPPPPPACAPDGRGARSRRPQGLKSGGCEGLTA